jgi:hypothetical protein
MKFTKGEKLFLFLIFLFGIFVMLLMIVSSTLQQPQQIFFSLKPQRHWQIESIDTMKYSRDMARQDLTDSSFAQEVDIQMTDIAATGANYVAIDTPYDSEFLPVLRVWVQSARNHGLHVWFRGNFSGWEGWFGYSQIDEQTHLAKTKDFILNNSDLFKDGDIFTSCPECENGLKLNTGDPAAVIAYRQFLISEYQVTKSSFTQIHKNVASNYFSMNADVARAIMDKATTQKLDGIVVIDHYVMTPEQLATETADIANQSGGSIVLGEFGAPIPDINGNMTDEQQKEWLEKSLQLLSGVNTLTGVNYWVDKGGSTALWRPDGTPKPAVDVIKQYYQ